MTDFSLPLKTSFIRNGRHTDARIWPAGSGTPSVVILFICGNPGLVDYYTDFLSTIHKSAPQTYEVIGVGHEGHSPEYPISYIEALDRPRLFRTVSLPSLAEQIQCKIAYVDNIIAQHGTGVKIVLIGHSVGAYIGQETLKARPDAVHALYGLFPTISHIAATPNGLQLRPLFYKTTSNIVVSLLAVLNFFLPFWALHSIVKIFTRQHLPASRVTAQLVHTPSLVASALAMADDEMRTIKDLDTTFLRDFGHKLTFYFAFGDSDGWVGSTDKVATITDALDKGQDEGDERRRWYICEKGMPHAFCLEHSQAMAEQCADWVSQHLCQNQL